MGTGGQRRASTESRQRLVLDRVRAGVRRFFQDGVLGFSRPSRRGTRAWLAGVGVERFAGGKDGGAGAAGEGGGVE